MTYCAQKNGELEKMLLKVKKTCAATIALLLMFSIASTILLTSAEDAYSTLVVNHKTFMYCSVGSSLLGLGQNQILVYWTADLPPDVGETDGVISGAFNRASWKDVSFNVTSPNGESTIIAIPLGQSDSVGGGYALYQPAETGKYIVTAIFPAQWKNSTLVNGASTPNQAGYPNPTNQYYTAATSEPVTFEVQPNALPLWNENPLPDDYWTRPINQASRLWGQLGGNWLAGSEWASWDTGITATAWQQPVGETGGTTTRYVYGIGTETSHILWTRPLYLGGLMDARFGDTGYMTGHYQGLDFDGALILNGRVYYPDRADAYRSLGFNVIDLYTGEKLMYINETMPLFGQIYNYDSPNQHGGYSFLWRTANLGPDNGTVLEMLDGYALPLRHVCYIANCSVDGTNVIGNNGEYLWYNLINYGTDANPNYYLTCWNNTNVLGLTASPPGTGTSYWQWRPEGGGDTSKIEVPPLSNSYVWDGRTGYTFNVSIPNPTTTSSIINQTGSILAVRVGDQNGKDGFVIIGTNGQNNELGDVKGQLWCLSLERGQEGKQLWKTSFSQPFLSLADNETSGGFFASFNLVGVYPEDNVILFHSSKQLKYWAIDMTTGAPLWETTREPDMNYYSIQTNYWNHTLYTTGYAGVCIAYDMASGKQLWNYTATNIGGESPYGNYPLNIFAVCDGKLYLLTGEHSVTQPMWRGPNIRCINATDGTEIWKILGMSADGGANLMGQYMQMADGKVVGLNYYDNQIYCIGQGKSKTTVTAPQTIPMLGSGVTITGSVTDDTQSGRRNTNNLYDFTLAGTPAISDDSMESWMEYLYMNQAKPTNATGVPVSLDAVDPNGNYIHVGDTMSDIYGNYGLKYIPEVPGTYQIIATFDGSKAYGGSSASTYLTVGEAPTSAPTTAPQAQSAADMYFVPAIAGLFVLTIVGFIVLALLMLRKRP